MKSKFLSLAAVLSIVCTGSVAADTNKWYVQADVGYALAADVGLENVATAGTAGQLLYGAGLDDAGKSMSYGLAFGYNVNENIRTELAVTIRSGFEVKDRDASVLAGNWDFQGDIHSTVAMANMYYTWNKLPVSPYVGLGLGYSQNKVKSLSYTDGTDRGLAPGGKENSFAYQLMLGLDYKINANWTLDLGYRYADLGDIKTKSGVNTTTTGDYLLDGSKGELKIHEAKLGVRYNF